MNVLRLKVSLSVLSLFFLGTVTNGQGNTNTDQNGNSQEAGMADLQLKPIRLPALQEVGGSPFMNDDYILGSVHVSPEKTVTNVPVKFNIFSNAVMVQKDGEEMRLESFDLVSYDVTGNDGATKHINFRQGYPEIDNHTATTIYQVLALGPKIQLLKFLSQKVEDAPTLCDYSRREIVTTTQLYIYIPGGEIKKIKPGKQSLVDALPGMSANIDEAIKAGDLNLKNESDIVIVVNKLNQ